MEFPYDYYAITLKEDGEFIGYGGTKWKATPEGPHLMCYIRDAFQERGYGEEATRAILEATFKGGAEVIYAEPNRNSATLVRKLGFQPFVEKWMSLTKTKNADV